MKTIFIMGILSFFCGISAAQPQYWGEETYDLENVAFRMTVALRFGKCGVRNEGGQVLFQGEDIRRGL